MNNSITDKDTIDKVLAYANSKVGEDRPYTPLYKYACPTSIDSVASPICIITSCAVGGWFGGIVGYIVGCVVGYIVCDVVLEASGENEWEQCGQHSREYYYCSSLPWQAWYLHGGVDIDNSLLSQVTPDDLINDENLANKRKFNYLKASKLSHHQCPINMGYYLIDLLGTDIAENPCGWYNFTGPQTVCSGERDKMNRDDLIKKYQLKHWINDRDKMNRDDLIKKYQLKHWINDDDGVNRYVWDRELLYNCFSKPKYTSFHNNFINGSTGIYADTVDTSTITVNGYSPFCDKQLIATYPDGFQNKYCTQILQRTDDCRDLKKISYNLEEYIPGNKEEICAKCLDIKPQLYETCPWLKTRITDSCNTNDNFYINQNNCIENNVCASTSAEGYLEKFDEFNCATVTEPTVECVDARLNLEKATTEQLRDIYLEPTASGEVDSLTFGVNPECIPAIGETLNKFMGCTEEDIISNSGTSSPIPYMIDLVTQYSTEKCFSNLQDRTFSYPLLDSNGEPTGEFLGSEHICNNLDRKINQACPIYLKNIHSCDTSSALEYEWKCKKNPYAIFYLEECVLLKTKAETDCSRFYQGE